MHGRAISAWLAADGLPFGQKALDISASSMLFFAVFPGPVASAN